MFLWIEKTNICGFRRCINLEVFFESSGPCNITLRYSAVFSPPVARQFSHSVHVADFLRVRVNCLSVAIFDAIPCLTISYAISSKYFAVSSLTVFPLLLKLAYVRKFGFFLLCAIKTSGTKDSHIYFKPVLTKEFFTLLRFLSDRSIFPPALI